MRILLRVLAVSALLVVVAVVAAVLVLPGVADSPAVRERIQGAAENALGRDVEYGALRFSLLPPSLLVEDVLVAGDTAGAPPLLESERVALRVALLPLLARTVVVDSLSVRGAKLNLVRSKEGLALPVRGAEGPESDAAARDGDAKADDGKASAFELAISSVDLSDARVLIEDRSVSPPAKWELGDLRAELRGTSATAPADVSFGFALASGGRISGKGSVTLERVVELEISLAAVAIEAVGAYLDSVDRLAGKADGTLTARGPLSDLEALHVDLAIAEGRVRIDDIEVVGPIAVVADLSGAASALRGSFTLDATSAKLEMSGVFTKPPGDAATLKGRVVEGPDGSTAIDDVQLKIRNFKGTASIRSGKRPRVVVSAPPFELAGWETLFPALAGRPLSGRMAFESLAIESDPLELRGRVLLDGVTTTLDEGGPLRVSGALVGSGASIVSHGLTLVAAEQPISLDVVISELPSKRRFRLASSAEAIDTNQLVTSFASKPDFAYGPLTFRGDLTGALAGARPVVETLAGASVVDIGPGRLVDVSLLKLAFKSLRGAAGLAQLASRLLAGPDLEPFYGDAFDSIRGSFDVDGGVVRTDDLRISYPDYHVDLSGDLRLRDLDLDMRGRIVLGDRLAATLGRGDRSATAREIRVARVTGSLDDPKVKISPEVAAAFLGRSGGGQHAVEAVEKAVGGELGEQVGDALRGLLGGGSRNR